MKNHYSFCVIVVLLLVAVPATAQINFSLNEASNSLPHLYGKKSNGAYLYTTAGDQLYAIGGQAGNFPAIGFHVPGEMGGIWQQPIKLFDGFRVSVTDSKTKVENLLNDCDSFITYSFTSGFRYTLADEQLTVTRTQFVPDGKPVLVVEYGFTNHSTASKNISVELAADANLMPVWLGERTGMMDSTDHITGFDKNTNTLLFKDNNNTWFAGVSSGKIKSEFAGAEKTAYKGKGVTGKLITHLYIEKGKTAYVRYYFSGSMKNEPELKANITTTDKQLADLFNTKKQRYARLEKNAAINIPDKAIAQAYQWGKYSSDWLVRDIPGMGKAMSAGLPDYPWVFSNDQAATFNALVGTVQPDIFFSSWKMLGQLSDKVNDNTGSIIHEASANGAVYATGRMEESQLHIIAAWNIFRWSGNLSFLQKNYERGKKIWVWLQQHDTNNNGYIEGYGGAEIEGLNEEMLDVQVHTYTFLEVMGDMAMVQGDKKAAAGYKSKASVLKDKINKDWWVPEENRYADFISSKEKAVEIIESALSKRVHAGRNDWAKDKLTALKSRIENGTYTNKGYVVYYNGAGILPVDEGMADTAKALQVLKNIHWFTNKYGLYITGIERPDDLSIDEGNFKHDAEFNYNRAVMPAATAGIIISACRYGSTDTALKYMHTILNSFSYATPGTVYEVSPDYGMFVQAWNIIGFDAPLLQYFFGIAPMAYKKEITLQPNFPVAWNKAEIKDVIIGDNRLSIRYSKTAKAATYRIKLLKPGWSVKLLLPVKKTMVVNGKKITTEKNYIVLTAKENTVQSIQ